MNRIISTAISIICILSGATAAGVSAAPAVEQWKIFELSFRQKAGQHPFDNIDSGCTFINGCDTVKVSAFYDGNDTYKIRFMPHKPGRWTYRTSGSSPKSNLRGSFDCLPASPGNHGPVRVNSLGFAYSDGTAYIPVGTTCYAWTHQPDSLIQLTLETLRNSCFNKIRMCIFPKSYDWNRNEPILYPFEGETGSWDFNRLNPAYFRNIEQCIASLDSLGIEADLIVYHPYDRWGFSKLDKETRDRYMQYVISRFGAFKNVWWSMANEYDFMEAYDTADWQHHLRFFALNDPYGHLRGIHNGVKLYDQNDPYVTHVSIQSSDMANAGNLRSQYRKPVIYDECRYEGNIPWVWGTLSAEEMVQKFWEGFTRGAFVGHGEVILTQPEVGPDRSDEILWWSKGGVLRGKSHDRIRYLKQILADAPSARLTPVEGITGWQNYPTLGAGDDWYLIYFGRDIHCQLLLELPENKTYRIELIDTWGMTSTVLDGTFSGHSLITLPQLPYMAARLTAVPR